jgi:hypothetical protein
MKKNMAGNTHSASTHNTDNNFAASHEHYRPRYDGGTENWFADHKKLLWGIGGAVALGAGAFIYLKNKNNCDNYSETYDQLNALNQDALNEGLGEEEVLVTTITELE